jgi:hypothetical protein
MYIAYLLRVDPQYTAIVRRADPMVVWLRIHARMGDAETGTAKSQGAGQADHGPQGNTVDGNSASCKPLE